MRVKVSICIPCFNQTQFLRKTLESVLIQDFIDFEVIIGDDSTTGEVEQLVTEILAGKKRNYRYFRNNPSLGSPANWNKAISMAKGEYIKIMHHDDWFASSSSLGKFVFALSEQVKSDFVFCDSEVFDVQNSTSRRAEPTADFLLNLRKDPTVLFNNNQIGSPSAMMFRSKISHLFDEGIQYLVDVDFYIRVLNSNPNYLYIHEALVVNTSNFPTQITAASLNKRIQIGEYCYLYNKTFRGKFPNRKLRLFFKDLFKWYKLSSFREIVEMGFETPKPEWIFKYLLFLARLK